MLCSISGTVPEEPVFCVKSGHVYEKRLVLKHVSAAGTEPVTGEACTPDDFLPVRSNPAVRPKPVAATSISSLLGMLQSEWDGLMLETFQLRQTLETTRQELSQALYQHDASCRVIARLVKERDQARAALTSAQAALAQRAAAAGAGAPSAAAAGAGAGGDDEMGGGSAAPAGLTQDTLQIMQDKYKELTKWRKKRPIPAETAAPASISALSAAGTFSPFGGAAGGISCLEAASQRGAFAGLALAGAADGSAALLEPASGRVVAQLASAGKRTVGAAFSAMDRESLLTAHADGAVRVWAPTQPGSREGWAPAITLRAHAGESVGISALPSGDYAVSASRDGSLTLLDSGAGKVLAIIPPEAGAGPAGVNGVRVHPDGLLVGLAGSAGLSFVDLRSQAVAARVGSGAHGGKAATALSFSENGFICASTGADGSVVTWDLRKAGPGAEPVVRAYALPQAAAGAAATCLAFDDSGYYLAAGGAAGGVGVWDTRAAAGGEASTVPIFSLPAAHKGSVTGLAWGALAKTFVSAGADGGVHVLRAT